MVGSVYWDLDFTCSRTSRWGGEVLVIGDAESGRVGGDRVSKVGSQVIVAVVKGWRIRGEKGGGDQKELRRRFPYLF